MSKKTRKFKTEVQQLLDLVIHSLYSKKEIFLRELLSNASDAIDRVRFEALTDESLMPKGTEGTIKIHADKDARTLTVSDNGIGMTADEVEANIGTIANSGTRRFLEGLQAGDVKGHPELIGQFGVGFYASFMVADQVTVITKRAGHDQQAVRWTSTGAGNYTLEDAERDGHGTDVILHLREGMDEYLEEWRIRGTVKAYSDYISFPIVMDVTRTKPAPEAGDEAETVTEEETLNSMKAIWKRDKAEVTPEEYNEFYKHLSHDYNDPLEVVPFAAEGATEFRALLFIPGKAPFDLFVSNQHHGLHLYVRNVFITDTCKELIPEYLRFMRGVVDSTDLPLNVSREMLQDDAIIKRIRKSLVTKTLKTLADLKQRTPETYAVFYKEFGRVLKEGLHFDFENHDKIKDLVLFPSSKTEKGKLASLREYVDRMPDGQKEIYYISGDSLDTVSHSPLLEAFQKRDYEVLFFVDPIDEWVAARLTEYDGKSIKPVDRGSLELGDEAEQKEAKAKREEAAKTHQPLLDYIKKALDQDIAEVRFSTRLTDSACCLVADEGALNANMERIMRAMNQEVPETKRILELNPDHPVVDTMSRLLESDKEDPRLADYVELLYGQALVVEGSPVKDPGRFARLVSKLMATEG
jgi:molecular chaperone HtpG